MRKFLVALCLLAVIAAAIAYGVWTEQRPAALYLSDLRIKVALDLGTPGNHGNLLGIQPLLFPSDYQSPQRLRRKLAAYLQQARDQGLINGKTIVVLPEHIGTWMLINGEKDELYQASSRKEAMSWLVLSNPLQFLRTLLRTTGDSRLDDAQLRMKAKAMAEDYQTLFGGLAKEFGVTLVAGSIVLPEPSVRQGRLHIGSGALYNCSLVFGSDGLAVGQPLRQLNPGEDDRLYIQPSAEQSLHIYPTPAGRLGILVGRDSWNADNYRKLDELGAQLIVVTGSSAGSSPNTSSKADMSVFSRGKLWDQISQGQSVISRDGQTHSATVEPGAWLLNLWL